MGVKASAPRVARKKTKRFLTRQGGVIRTDMVVPGMKYAVFVRSRMRMRPSGASTRRRPRRCRALSIVLDGKQLLADGDRQFICGWMIHSKDAHDRMGAWAAACPRDRALCRRRGGDRRRRQCCAARDAAEAVVVDYETLPGVTDTLQALGEGEPQIHPERRAI